MEQVQTTDNGEKAQAAALDLAEQVLVALRRVTRAIDLHSRKLVQTHGLTGPQALVLKETVSESGVTAGEVARRINLSQATVTDILNRLELRGLISRQRSDQDRRKVLVLATTQGRAIINTSPPLLQESFVTRFRELEEQEQRQLLMSLQRIAGMMDAGDLDAAPVLSSGSINASPEAVENVITPKPDEPVE